MTQLILTVERSPLPQLQGASASFDHSGGTVGRANDCTLVLPDPERVTSSIHARIEFSAGSFELVDTSTNGTFFRTPTSLIGRNRRVSLVDGDRVYIGDFVLRVDLEDDLPAQAPRSGSPAPWSADESLPAAKSDDAGDDVWDAGEFSLAWGEDEGPAAPQPPKKTQAEQDPEAGYSNSPEREYFAPPPTASHPTSGEIIPDDWDDFLTGFHGSGAGEKSKPAASASRPVAKEEDESDFWPESGAQSEEAPGADLDPLDGWDDSPQALPAKADNPRPSPPPAPPVAPVPAPTPEPEQAEPSAVAPPPVRASSPQARPQASGPAAALPADETHEVLLTITRGLMALLETRSEIKNEFRIAQTRFAQTENNPLKFSPNAEEALKRVLGSEESQGFLTGARAFEDALKDIQAHQLAILSAVQRAIETSIAQFDPAELEKKLQRISPISAATPGLKAAKCWNLFTVHYEEVAGRMRDDARKLFLSEFAEAYEEASSALARGNREEPR